MMWVKWSGDGKSWSLIVWMMFLSVFCSLVNADTISQENEVEEEVEPSVAVLFPWFTELLGVVAFLLLTRYARALPYTAVLFLLGTFMGVGTSKLGLSDQLTESIRMWDLINGDVLLSVFLPGLVFRDAYGLNVHLFQLSFYQSLIMAFPMVLAGTALTACVAYYIFPFGWSFNLAMTFGAILSATDPVAVNALLNEVGAPPRLKTHIAGESLLNDGSSIVFYTIFSLRFLHELGIKGLGEEVNWGEGFALFFREALGGVLVGLVFAIGLVALLHHLDRRLNEEENVVQVAATVTVAYLTYFTADSVLEMSGVIAVVFCGLATKALGDDLINDKSKMDGFWMLLEHLLNTVLFALGGVVWGVVISNQDERYGLFGGTEWAYLILLYVLLMAIRFFLFFAAYPILSRIGLGSNLKETTFISYGGLRGAVGIALAISLDNEVFSITTDETYRTFTTQLFGFVGGIALMTLLINGTSAGPLLRKLGLVTSSATRLRILERYRQRTREHLEDDFVHLLTLPHFSKVNFAVVQHHVPLLRDLTLNQFYSAIARNKARISPSDYNPPSVEFILPYLEAEPGTTPTLETSEDDTSMSSSQPVNYAFGDEMDKRKAINMSCLNFSTSSLVVHKELRMIFIEILRFAYERQISKGELDTREGILSFMLLQSLEIAADEASKGGPLKDWEVGSLFKNSFGRRFDRFLNWLFVMRKGLRTEDINLLPSDHFPTKISVHRAVSFIEAHRFVQERFKAEFLGTQFSEAANIVLQESEAQVLQAENDLASYNKTYVEQIMSHLLCQLLLNKAARIVEHLLRTGLLVEREASAQIEKIEHSLLHLQHCSALQHPGELDAKTEDE